MAARSEYSERPAPDGLRAWAPCMWVRLAPNSGETVAATRVVPDGCVDLIWAAGRLEAVGPDSEPRYVPLTPGDRIAGVRLRPGAARPLLGDVPATALLNRQIELADLWGSEATPLEDRIGELPPWRAAEHLAEALTARLRTYEPDPLVVAVAARLDRPRPPAVKELAWELGFSERQLRRRVEAATGYGPKTLEQILRFHRVLDATGRDADLARLAAEQGYADQAHLTRQVRRWSGVTPGTLAAQAALSQARRVRSASSVNPGRAWSSVAGDQRT